jgi:hypothetical protein
LRPEKTTQRFSKRKITNHCDAGKVSLKQLQKGLGKKLQKRKLQKRLDVVKRKRRQKVARQARLLQERLQHKTATTAALQTKAASADHSKHGEGDAQAPNRDEK